MPFRPDLLDIVCGNIGQQNEPTDIHVQVGLVHPPLVAVSLPQSQVHGIVWHE